VENDTGLELARLRPIPLEAIFALSADGGLLALAAKPGLIELFDATSGTRLAELRHPATELDRSLTFTPDGSRLLSGDKDCTILVWHVRAALKGHLPAIKPLNPAERQQHWTALRSRKPAELRADHVRRLLSQLNDDSFELRERATRALAAIGEPAREALEQAVRQGGSAEVKKRAAKLLGRLGTKDLTPDQLRALRAVRLLERIGGPSARRVIERLARGSAHDRVTRAAVAGLRRMKAKVTRETIDAHEE
jgi:hypothetical protein